MVNPYAMHHAAVRGYRELLEKLIDSANAQDDADFNPADDDEEPGLERRDHHGCTPLHGALLHGHLGCVELCLARGAEVWNPCNGSSVLHIAAARGGVVGQEKWALEALTMLLDAGMDPAVRDAKGRTALHWCACGDLTECAELLVARASRTGENQRGDGEMDPGLARLLEQETDPHRRAILMEELGMGGGSNLPSEEDFLDNEPLVAMRDGRGESALHWAARARQRGMVEWLLEHAAPLDAADAHGRTAAHFAALAGWSEGVRLLTREASVASLTDAHGKTAAQTLDSMGVTPETCLVYTDSSFLSHFTSPPGHDAQTKVPAAPENPERLQVLLHPERGALRRAEFQRELQWKEENLPRARMADILRVHSFEYVSRIMHMCENADQDPAGVHTVDLDTALSSGSWEAARRAAGAVCDAVDRVLADCSATVTAGAGTGGETTRLRRAFCAVRPPGHHAGPWGRVVADNEREGGLGFCLLNNVAIGAAYARARYHDKGIRRVVIFDFDVHHGNGTEAIVRNVVPSEIETPLKTPFATGVMRTASYMPWLDEDDSENVLFVSAHGYGKDIKAGPVCPDSWFYPGSGVQEGYEPMDNEVQATNGNCKGETKEEETDGRQVKAEDDEAGEDGEDEDDDDDDDDDEVAEAMRELHRRVEAISGRSHLAPEKSHLEPNDLNWADTFEDPTVINVALPKGHTPQQYRELMAARILPRVAAFDPDLILISAGFDAHHEDEMNHDFGSLRDEDYEWITDQLVKLANTHCDGRIVSVLEGGYQIHGGLVSAFARAAMNHVRALTRSTKDKWNASVEGASVAREATAEREFRARMAAAADEDDEDDDDNEEEEEEEEKGHGGGAAQAASGGAGRKRPREPSAAELPSHRQSKRLRTKAPVDFAKLSREMDEEERAAGK